jgi:hypothetical protein
VPDAWPPHGPADVPAPASVPPEHAALAQRLRSAENRLFPIAMVDADRYERAVRLVGLLARRLAGTASDLDGLAAAEPQVRDWLVADAREHAISLVGLDHDLVVEAAMSQRFRALLSEQATELQRAAVERARLAGETWAVLEEPGPAAWSGGSARWVEVHVASGAVLVRSAVTDPTTGVAAYRLEVMGGGDGADGAGVRAEDFTERDGWLAGIAEARAHLETQS